VCTAAPVRVVRPGLCAPLDVGPYGLSGTRLSGRLGWRRYGWGVGRLAAGPVFPYRTCRLFAFFHVAAYTGARRGELLNLRWRDVDMDGAVTHIRGSAAFVAGERIEGTTKSGRSRVVSIDPGTVSVLRAHRKRQLADMLQVGNSWKGSADRNADHVFMTVWGEPIHPDTVSSLMAILIKNHNAPKEGETPTEPLPHARLHDLRHLHATTLLLVGVPVHVVAARLGHADPSITLRVYAHVINEQLVEAADIFARAIDEAA
jgi:integrase